MARRPAALLVVTALFAAAPGVAAAKGPIEVITFTDTFVDVNPCTERPHTITADFVLRVHEFEIEKPSRHHFNVQFFLMVSTSDGFSGRAVGPDIDNGAGLFGDDEGKGVFTSIINAVIGNPSTGQRFRVHGNFHITIVGGEPASLVERFSVRCLKS